jgi:hypothetical protein
MKLEVNFKNAEIVNIEKNNTILKKQWIIKNSLKQIKWNYNIQKSIGCSKAVLRMKHSFDSKECLQ